MPKLPLKIFDDGDEERIVNVPFTIEICPACNGRGTTSRDVECDGGGFTASEWADQDEDFREDYMAGVYDRPCDECRGLPGRVKVPDLKCLSRRDRKLYREQQQADADYRRVSEAERRMGA